MSAIYKEGYWYPADSLNTLKAVTMSNADYEALTPQEKEELGGIEIFIPDRPLTGGGTGAVIIYNGVEYAGTPTSRLETLEEIVGDGQQSVGSDLTDAVTQLNSSLNNISSGTVTWNTNNVSGNVDRRIWFKMGKLVIATLEFTPLSGKMVNNEIICTGLPIPNRSRRYMYGGNSQQMTLDVSNNEGVLVWYYPFDTTTLNRIDVTIMYFTS